MTPPVAPAALPPLGAPTVDRLSRIRGVRWACTALLLSKVAGCASTTDVRMLATGTAAAAYELRGNNLPTLDLQARRLCPGGHEVLHQWERLQLPPADAGAARRAWQAGTQALGWTEGDQARITVQCKAAWQPVPPPPAPQPPSAPEHHDVG